jgi:thioredoxin reductase
VVQVRAGGDGFEVVTLNSGKLHAHAVIVATGVMPYRLDVPGAAEYLGHGLGYSATTYARQLEGKRVAVIGNTLRALRGAAEVAQGAQQVYLLPGVDGAGDPLLEMMRRQPNVAVLDGYEVVALDGATYLERLVVAHGDELQALAVDAAFADLGLRPNSLAVRELAALDAEGFVVVDARQATSVPGLFAAGDVATSFGEQLLIATGDGARAALGAYDYLLAKRMLDGLGGRD